jgi:HK97 family phage major capsid protein
MNEAEAGQFEEHTKELRDLAGRIAIMEEHEDRDRTLNDDRNWSGFSGLLAGMSGQPGGDFADPMDADVRAFLRGEKRTIDVSFSGLQKVRKPDGEIEIRNILTTTSGAPIPTSFRNVLYQHLVQSSAVRRICTVIPTTSGEHLILPKTTAHPASGTIVPEANTLGESDPSFGQGTLTSYKYGNLIQISTETEQDTNVDLTGYIAKAMGRSLGLGSGAHFVTGTGSSQPQGFLVGAGTASSITGGTPASSGATFNELTRVFDGIIPPYQVNGSWLMGQGALQKIRALVNTQGTPLFVESLSGGSALTLFGRPIEIDPAMPAVAVSGTSIAFGDFSTYFVRDLGVRFERSLDYAFGNDLVTYRALLRTDGLLLDTTGSIATYKGGTA